MPPTHDPLPKLTPGCHNLAWSLPATLKGETPILAILELPVRHDVDLFDPGLPLHGLLRQSTEYMASIPGARVYCGRSAESGNSLSLLVQLSSARAWQDLQTSAALAPLLATLEANPVNRCSALELPRDLSTGDRVELLTISHRSQADFQTSSDRDEFSVIWSDFANAVKLSGVGEAFGNWLEADAMMGLFFDRPVGRRNAILEAWDRQPVHFLGLVCGKKDSKASLESAEYRSLVARLSEYLENRVSSKIVELQSWASQDGGLHAAVTLPSPLTAQAILSHSVRPVHRRDNGVGISGWDINFHNSYNATRQGRRLCPEPHGSYHPVGTSNQYTCPVPLQAVPMQTDKTLYPVDVLFVKFRQGHLDERKDWPSPNQALAQFRNVRKQISQSEHCKDVKWATKYGERENIVLFIIWNSRESRTTALLSISPVNLLISAISNHLEREPVRGPSWALHPSVLHQFLTMEHWELITFTTPDHPGTKLLLEIYHRQYSITAELDTAPAGQVTAGRCISSGFASSSDDLAGSAEYVALWRWHSNEAREQWYRDFYDGMVASYESLGHIANALHLVASGGIRSELLDLQLEQLGFGES